MRRALKVVMIMLLFGATAAVAEQPDRWLHVRVRNTTAQAQGIVINLPLSLVEKTLRAASADELQAGTLNMHKAGSEALDLRALLEALHTTGNYEFRMQSPKETVQAVKVGDRMVIKIRENREAHRKVDITIPVAVLDALLSGPRGQLDLVAGVRALNAYGNGDLVAAEDAVETVRVWVDSQSTPSKGE